MNDMMVCDAVVGVYQVGISTSLRFDFLRAFLDVRTSSSALAFRSFEVFAGVVRLLEVCAVADTFRGDEAEMS